MWLLQTRILGVLFCRMRESYFWGVKSRLLLLAEPFSTAR
jgi:hypothetical protein